MKKTTYLNQTEGFHLFQNFETENDGTELVNLFFLIFWFDCTYTKEQETLEQDNAK